MPQGPGIDGPSEIDLFVRRVADAPTPKPTLETTDRHAAGYDPVEEVLARLRSMGREPKHRKGETWEALCPAHGDHRASLNVSRGTRGEALVKCHAGCDFRAITAALGLTEAEMFVSQRARPRRELPATVDPLQDAAEAVGRQFRGTCIATYPYPDAAGEPVLAIARYETYAGKEFRAFHPDGDGDWRIGGPAGRLPLYRLPEIADSPVAFVFEGEKLAEQAAALGLPATTSAFGAGSASKTDWRPMAGKTLYIVPDNDQAGEQYARDVAEACADLIPQPAVRTVRLPDLAEGEDFEQWVERLPETWEPERVRAEFEMLVAHSKFAAPAGNPTPKLTRAVDWLRTKVRPQFAAGPIPASVVAEQAESVGISPRTLRRAGLYAGVEAQQIRGRRGWWYVAPGWRESSAKREGHPPTEVVSGQESGSLAKQGGSLASLPSLWPCVGEYVGTRINSRDCISPSIERLDPGTGGVETGLPDRGGSVAPIATLAVPAKVSTAPTLTPKLGAPGRTGSLWQ